MKKNKKQTQGNYQRNRYNRMQLSQEDHRTTECWIASNNPIVRQTVYNLADKYDGTFLNEFATVKETYEFNLQRYGKSSIFGDHFKYYNENRLVEHSLILIETASAMQETQAAKEIQERALELLDDTRLKSALP